MPICRHFILLMVSVVALALVSTNEARADDDDSSYGAQIAIADGTALAIGLTVGLASDKGSSRWLAGGFLGAAMAITLPPVIHFAHGNVGNGFKSLGVRSATFFLAPLTKNWAAIIGLGLVASAVDVFVIAREPGKAGTVARPRMLLRLKHNF